MLTKNNKHLYFPMQPEIALALIHEWIKAGEGPLGMQFGWVQPDNDTTITLGDVYTDSYDRDLKSVLFSEEYNYSTDKYNWTLNFSLGQTKRILRILKDHDIDYHNKYFKFDLPDVIFCNEHLSCKFTDLDTSEKCMYRLSILMLNTMTEGHNLACEYLEYLAHAHYHNGMPDNDKNWSIYDNDNWGYKADILEIIMETPENLNIYLPYDSPEYHLSCIENLRDNQKLFDDCLAYVKQAEEIYQETYEHDLISEVFNLNLNYQYGREEILQFLAWIIAWITNEYMLGNLTFAYTDQVDSKELKQRLFQYQNQTIMDL